MTVREFLLAAAALMALLASLAVLEDIVDAWRASQVERIVQETF